MNPANDNAPQQRPEWFDALLLKYMPFTETHCRKTASHLDKEEYSQETMRYALSYWHRYKREKNFTSFIALMAREAKRDMQKRAFDRHADDHCGVAHATEANQEQAAHLSSVLASMYPERRNLAVLVAAGYTGLEISARLGVSDAAVESRKRDMRAALAANDNKKRAA